MIEVLEVIEVLIYKNYQILFKMQIELFFNELWFISWLRKNWKPWAKNKPILQNTYIVDKLNYPKLVKFILWWTAYLVNSPPKILWWKPKTSLDLWFLKLGKADYDDTLNIKNNLHLIK